MGAVLSCLGIRRQDPDAEDSETSRLLSDDPFQSRYGTIPHGQRRTAHQPDPEAIRREREAMGRIVDAMSDEVVDIFSGTLQPATQDRHQSFQTTPRTNNNGASERTPEEIAIRTLRKARDHRITSVLDVDTVQRNSAES